MASRVARIAKPVDTNTLSALTSKLTTAFSDIPETALHYTCTVHYEGKKPFTRKHETLEALQSDALQFLRGHYGYAKRTNAGQAILDDIAAASKSLLNPETLPLSFETHRLTIQFWATMERAVTKAPADAAPF